MNAFDIDVVTEKGREEEKVSKQRDWGRGNSLGMFGEQEWTILIFD